MKLGTHALIYFRITKPLHPEYHFGSEIFYMNHASFVVQKKASFKVKLPNLCRDLLKGGLQVW